MCNQTVSLVAAELERNGISTVAVQLLRSIAEKVRPPRALSVPFKHGLPLGQPHNREIQRSVIEAALSLLEDTGLSTPHISDFSMTEEVANAG